MQISESTESAPNAELEAKIHQNHRGLTTLLLRRRGRPTFKAIHLEGKDGGSVGHREPPSDKPGDVATTAWTLLGEHAVRYGSGTYEVELVFAAHEKGPAPKPVIVQLAVGDDVQDIGHGTDPAVIVELCMRMSSFCVTSMQSMLSKLPEVAEETTANLRELRKLGTKMFETMQAATQQSDKIAVARIEQEASAQRLAFAREFVGPGLDAIRGAMGGGLSQSFRDAAASPAPSSTPAAPLTPAQENVAKLQAEAVSVGRELAASLSKSQLEQLGHVIGAPLVQRLDAMRRATTHGEVMTVGADLLSVGLDKLQAVLQLLSEDQNARVDRLQAVADALKKASAST